MTYFRGACSDPSQKKEDIFFFPVYFFFFFWLFLAETSFGLSIILRAILDSYLSFGYWSPVCNLDPLWSLLTPMLENVHLGLVVPWGQAALLPRLAGWLHGGGRRWTGCSRKSEVRTVTSPVGLLERQGFSSFLNQGLWRESLFYPTENENRKTCSVDSGVGSGGPMTWNYLAGRTALEEVSLIQEAVNRDGEVSSKWAEQCGNSLEGKSSGNEESSNRKAKFRSVCSGHKRGAD